MEFEVKRKVKKEVEETFIVEMQKFFLLRIIKEDNTGNKNCVYEEEFINIPDKQTIATVIISIKEQYKPNTKLFASLIENYRLIEKVE